MARVRLCRYHLLVRPCSYSPEFRDLFAAGKPENKLLLFWRMGMPVVTSASPAYVRAMSASLNLTAQDETDWLSILTKLVFDHNSRQLAGTLGSAYVAREFTKPIFFSLGFRFRIYWFYQN